MHASPSGAQPHPSHPSHANARATLPNLPGLRAGPISSVSFPVKHESLNSSFREGHPFAPPSLHAHLQRMPSANSAHPDPYARASTNPASHMTQQQQRTGGQGGHSQHPGSHAFAAPSAAGGSSAGVGGASNTYAAPHRPVSGVGSPADAIAYARELLGGAPMRHSSTNSFGQPPSRAAAAMAEAREPSDDASLEVCF